MKKIVSLLVLTVSLALVSAPALVLAYDPGEPEYGVNLTAEQIKEDVLPGIRNWVAGIVGILGVIMILWGAISYMTAGGDEEKVGKAKKTIVYGIIGIAIAILAYGVFALVESFLE